MIISPVGVNLRGEWLVQRALRGGRIFIRGASAGDEDDFGGVGKRGAGR